MSVYLSFVEAPCALFTKRFRESNYQLHFFFNGLKKRTILEGQYRTLGGWIMALTWFSSKDVVKGSAWNSECTRKQISWEMSPPSALSKLYPIIVEDDEQFPVTWWNTVFTSFGLPSWKLNRPSGTAIKLKYADQCNTGHWIITKLNAQGQAVREWTENSEMNFERISGV